MRERSELIESKNESNKELKEDIFRVEGLRIATGIISKRLNDMPNLFPGSYRNQSYSAADLLALLRLIVEDINAAMNSLASGKGPYLKKIGASMGPLDKDSSADIIIDVEPSDDKSLKDKK
jgi:hypothetical protein